MIIKKIFQSNKLLARLIISYFITSVLLTSILMLIVSAFVSTYIEKRTTAAATDLLSQSYSTAYYALTDIYGDYYEMWSKNELIKNVLGPSPLSEEDYIDITETFDTEIFRNDLIESIYLINKHSNTVISNISSYDLENFQDQDALLLFDEFEKHYNTYKDEIFFPRSVQVENNGHMISKNLISIIYSVKDDNGQLSSGIMVNINQDRLSKLINTDNDSNLMIIVNSKGKVISDSKGNFGFTLPRDDFYMTIANSTKIRDNFTSYFMGEKSFVTYIKAMDLGFVFISITPYSILEHEIIRTNSIVAIFFIISMIISLIVSFYSTKKIYDPLNEILLKMKENPSISGSMSLDEYELLGETYNSLVVKDKETHLSRIFNGSYGETSLEILGYNNDNKYMTFSVIPDDEEDITNEILEKIVELINQNTNWAAAITASNCVSSIINSYDFNDDKIESIIEVLINLQKVISDELYITVSIGLGTMVNNLDSIKFSHRYAMLAVQNALSNGENQVVYYNDIENSKVAASQNKDSIANKIKEYVDNNFTRQDFSVDEISNEVNLSLGYIRQIFKNEKGITLNDYIIDCRIEMAKHLLKTTDKTAKDIAEEVGYFDNRYFYTLFKKKVGMTTDEYRKSSKEGGLNEAKESN
ncbi:AraC family transcriptional regulator [Tissierella sp. Yu-01]|uniref:AraC family transcriptional regulator n=1 Tax=Tissierella sp. Yu-01 TaxID=3035694 RepID=UPI00240CEB98|nr:AraC family transcriptional regulator [Tissierella sp. Yu-01]WFA08161.1 AraC family transcriptional regulator [Tissierella sp. Yu-01]